MDKLTVIKFSSKGENPMEQIFILPFLKENYSLLIGHLEESFLQDMFRNRKNISLDEQEKLDILSSLMGNTQFKDWLHNKKLESTPYPYGLTKHWGEVESFLKEHAIKNNEHHRLKD